MGNVFCTADMHAYKVYARRHHTLHVMKSSVYVFKLNDHFEVRKISDGKKLIHIY